MATIDQYGIDVKVTGAETLDTLNARVGSIDKTIKQVNDTARSFNTRTIVANIQDIAVEAELGVNPLRILGQQGSELLAGLGKNGAIAGAALAVGIAIARPVLGALGFDLRNLKEMSDDLTKSFQELRKAQETNLPSVEGLSIKYGDLAESVKRYNEATEGLDKKTAIVGLEAQIESLRSKYTVMGDDVESASKKAGDAARYDMGGSLTAVGLSLLYLRLTSGLTTEQIQILGKNLKDLGKNPDSQAIVDTMAKIKKELQETNISASQLRDIEASLKPISSAADGAKQLKENINAASDASARFNTEILAVQLEFTSRIGNAQRSNNNFLVAELTQQEKLKEIAKERDRLERDGKLTQETRAELSAKENLILAQTAEKRKDISKAQQETFYAQQLTNETEERSLTSQKQINEQRLLQIDSLKYESLLEEARITNAGKEVNQLLAVQELLRKNLITTGQGKMLDEQAATQRKMADEVALQGIEKIRAENQRSIRLQAQALDFIIYQRGVALELEMKGFNLSSREQEYSKKKQELAERQMQTEQEIRNNNRLSDEEKQQALANINKLSKEGLEILKKELGYRLELDQSYSKGALDRYKQIQESFTPFKQGGMMVDAVFNQMNSAIDNFVDHGKFSFSDFTRSVINDLIKIQLKAQFTQLIGNVGGLFGFGGGKAVGGPVDSGTAYVVGEQGPELFIPSGAGSIVPNSKMNAGSAVGSTNVVYNIQAVDAMSFKQMLARDPSFLYAVSQQGARSVPMNGR